MRWPPMSTNWVAVSKEITEASWLGGFGLFCTCASSARGHVQTGLARIGYLRASLAF